MSGTQGNGVPWRFKYLRGPESDAAWHCLSWVELPFVGTSCGLLLNLALCEVWLMEQHGTRAVFTVNGSCPLCRAAHPDLPVWGDVKANNLGKAQGVVVGDPQGHSQVGAGGAAGRGMEAPGETA